jgi:hypothetical protein
MRSALYYPHTTIRNEIVLKRALLLWDSIEYIVPDRDYKAQYSSTLLAEAAELVAEPHVPSLDEQTEAHKQIEDFATSSLPDAFFFRSLGVQGDYEIYPQKLLPDTFDLLKKLQIAGDPRANADFPFSRPAGLSVMSILADCCAGKTRARVTDQGAAYATISNLLQGSATDYTQTTAMESSEQFVSVSLEVIDAGSIDLQKLVDFRKRERKSGGHAHRDLRHRYVDRMEAHVETLTKTKGTKGDAAVLTRQLNDEMKDDLTSLREELGFARNEVLFSKEMITAAVAGLGTIASFAFGAPYLVAGLVTSVGAPVAIGGLLGSHNKFLSSRKAILQKHPMAYLYELQGSQQTVSL